MVETRDFEEAARKNPKKANLASYTEKRVGALDAVLAKKACSWVSLTEEHYCCANQTAPARNGNLWPSLNALICAIPGNLLILH